MSDQLNPCNKCWEDLDYFEETIKGIEHFVTKCACKEFSREVIVHKYCSDHTFKRWQKTNPISHAGKMLLEDNHKTEMEMNPHEYMRLSTCRKCNEWARTKSVNAVENMKKIHQENTDCPLITEANLPLKVKDGE